MRVFKSPPRLALAVALAAALAACGAPSALGAKLWPFGGGSKPAASKESEEGRISILSFDQTLAADPALAGRSPEIPSPVDTPDWSQPGGPPSNAPVHINASASLKVDWREGAGEGSSRKTWIGSPPVIAGGKLYVFDGGQEVHAMDAVSGRRLWEHAVRPAKSKDKDAIGGGIAVADGRVYVSTGYGNLLALDAATGKQLWITKTPAPFRAAPTVADGRLFCVTSEGELLAVDATNGDVQWTYQAIAEPAGILGASSPAVSGDTVIAPFTSGEVVALLVANGRRLWVDALTRNGRLTSLSTINDIAGRPVAADGVVYAVSHSGVIAATDQRTGDRIWARGLASTQTPWVAGDALYIITVDGQIAALDRKTGGAFWVTQLRRYDNVEKKKGLVAWTGPILVGGNLVVASTRGEVDLISPATGAINNKINVGDPIFVPPVAANGYVYLVNDKAKLIALH